MARLARALRTVSLGCLLLCWGLTATPPAAAGYRPLDLARAAVEQYGPGAGLMATGSHLYAWRARVGGRLLPLDLRLAVARQYGSGWVLGAVGMHSHDWRAIHWAGIRAAVLPVLLVASDRAGDINGVAKGLVRFRSVMARVRSWYQRRCGRTFRLMQPLVLPTRHNSAHWDGLCRATLDDRRRYGLLQAAIAEYRGSLPDPGSRVRVVLAPYSGTKPKVWMGAASQGPFAVIPSYGSSILVPASGGMGPDQKGVCYAIAHELGHAFGLGHPCSAPRRHGDCARSVMESAQPPEAILTPPEIAALRASPFFR